MNATGPESPEQILALAIAIEKANAERYRLWAHRFRTFDTEVAELLSELAFEECRHQSQLTERFGAHFRDAPPPVDKAAVREHLVELPEPEPHFFVVDTSMARRILETALAAERRTLSFYQSVLEHAEGSVLGQVVAPLVRFEADHVDRIAARLESFAGR